MKDNAGCPTSPISCEVSWFRELHAPFLKERRTRGLVHRCVQEIRGISLVFREMWDTTAPTPRPSMKDTATECQRTGRVPHVRPRVRGPKKTGRPGFPATARHQHPRVRLSLRKAA